MKNTLTKLLFIVLTLLLNFAFVEAQSLTAISPDIAQQGQTLSTTITATGNIFVPGSPMGGTDIWMIKSGGGYQFNSNNGSVTFNNGNSVSVNWNFPGGAPTGMYDLHVDATDGAGGWATYSLPSIFQIGCLTSLSQTHTNTTCGNANGAIDLTATSGTPPYSFAWSNGATTEDLSLLAQGIYSVTVTDASPCSQILSNIIIGNTNGPSVTETHLSSTCANANGSVNITVTGGTPPYSFNWSNGATTEDIASLSAGTYLVTVTDFNSCAGYVSSTVLDSNELDISLLSVQYNCSNQGALTVIVNSGTAPFSYLWSNGSTNDSLINVPSGTYHVTVTDALGCVQVQTNSVLNIFNYYVFLTAIPTSCGSSNGSISTYISGGVAPFTYLWSTGATASSISLLPVGSYTVTVTDVNGCTRWGSCNIYNSNQTNYIEGFVFEDANSNCLKDTTETGFQGVYVYAHNGSNYYYGTTTTNGYYFIPVIGMGPFTVSLNNIYSCTSYTLCGNAVNPISFSTSCGDSVSNCDFSILNPGSFDLSTHQTWSSGNPGFQKRYSIYAYNSSNIPFTDTATIVFSYDPILEYHDSIPPNPVHDSIAHTLTWQATNISYNYYTPRIAYFHVPVSAPIGYILQSDFYIYPDSGDCLPYNNHTHTAQAISGSYDPNEKEVSPEGNLLEADSILTYTIHFQNTGNDTTSFLVVKDTLSQYLDPLSVINISSSHMYSDFNISGSGILTWIFNPIFLVDSFTNEPDSKGFITFSIHKRDSLPFGTQINNTASIYFDYNLPVITNTVQNTIINSVKNISDKTVTVVAYPNPFFESTMFVVNGINGECNFELTNVLGEKVKEIKHINTKQFTFNRTDLSQGIYFYKIVVEGKTIATGKLVAD